MARTTAGERARLRAELGTLALEVVRKLLGPFADDEVLAALAATAAADLMPLPALTLAVHPDHCDPVRERLLAATAGVEWEVRADPSCPPATCRLETEHGSIDASLDAQLTRIAAAWGAAGTTAAS
jgi:flagellar biosynthesis/type III secretory pathway protein FliH